MHARFFSLRTVVVGWASVSGAFAAAADLSEHRASLPPLPQLQIPAVSVPLPVPPPLRRHFVECDHAHVYEEIEYERTDPTAFGLVELFGGEDSLRQAMDAVEVTVSRLSDPAAAGTSDRSKTRLSVTEAARVATILTTDFAYHWNRDDEDTIDYQIGLEFRAKRPVSVGRLPPEYRESLRYDYRIELRHARGTVAAELASGSKRVRIIKNDRPVAEAWIDIGYALIEDILVRCERAADE